MVRKLVVGLRTGAGTRVGQVHLHLHLCAQPCQEWESLEAEHDTRPVATSRRCAWKVCPLLLWLWWVPVVFACATCVICGGHADAGTLVVLPGADQPFAGRLRPVLGFWLFFWLFCWSFCWLGWVGFGWVGPIKTSVRKLGL